MEWESRQLNNQKLRTQFGVAISQKTSTVDPDKSRGPRDILLALRLISDPYLLFVDDHCLSCTCDFTESAKFFLEKYRPAIYN